jgi:hypothetical protein
LCDQLALGLKATGFPVLLNLNAAQAPRWASDAVEGPLFAGLQPQLRDVATGPLALSIVEHLVERQLLRGRVRVNWHVREADFDGRTRGRAGAPLVRLARLALDGQNVAFAFDRPRRPHVIGPGLGRGQPAVLLAATLNLPRLLRLRGVGDSQELFLKKVAGLAGMAVSAAVQKRNFVRERGRGPGGAAGPVNRRFLLARSRLAVEPVGLAAVVRHFGGEAPGTARAGVDFARHVLQVLADTLRERGARSNLDVCLCSLDGLELASRDASCSGAADQALAPFAAERAAGFGVRSPEAPWRDQLRAAGQLHSFASGATATLLLGPDRGVSAEELAGLVHFSLAETTVQQLAVHRLSPEQLTLPGL